MKIYESKNEFLLDLQAEFDGLNICVVLTLYVDLRKQGRVHELADGRVAYYGQARSIQCLN